MPKKAKPETASIFVPEAEQPYKIPDNWRWVRLSALASPSKETTADFSADIRYVGLEHMETGRGIISYGNAESVKSVKNVFHDGQILYGKLRPYLNKHDIADFSGVCSTDILVFEQTACSCAKYVNYYFDLPYFFEYAVSHSRGIHLPRVTESILLNAACPLPPLAEQQRIVERIESLFTKLDAAREKAREVVDGFELRKAAILYRAFTGKLTGIKSYATIPLSMIADEIRIGPFGSALHKDDYVSGKIPVINPKHIIDQNIVPDSKTSISEAKAKELSAYILKQNDIILARRGTMGRSAPVTEKEDGWLCGTGSMIIRLKKGYDAVFYSQVLSSGTSVRYLEENAVGSTMSNLNEKIIRDLPVPNFSAYEQEKILAIISDLLNGEYQVMESAQQVIDNIDAMKKAILGRAFRGELGTNDPSEASPDFAVTVR